ncbi:MAG: hypothetical protein UH850_17605 [Paludibacteraceae bacterium]|nr:hypothetical protein [Paludibacteraceae bacterium]
MKNKTEHIIIMILLAITNIISFYNQPFSFSPFDETNFGNKDLSGILIWALRLGLIVYLPLIIAGTYSLVKSISAVIKGEQGIMLRIVTFTTLFSLILVFFGTFFKESYNDFYRNHKFEKENVIIKSYADNFQDGHCIWRGDTIIERSDNSIDTLIIDAKSNTCHWTYKPEINYEIIFDHRARFKESPKNKTYAPFDYEGKIQYIINCVNNKPVDQIYYDERCCKRKYDQDSLIVFIVDDANYCNDNKFGFLLFNVKDSIATLSDSSSFYNINENVAVRNHTLINKANGMPLIRIDKIIIDTLKGKRYSCNETYNTDYYDIENKKFVLKDAILKESRTDTITRQIDGNDVSYRQRRKINVFYSDDAKLDYKTGYPIIDYVKTIWYDSTEYSEEKTDTLEKGQYRMTNGMYQKFKE